jgi:hypothetical protein
MALRPISLAVTVIAEVLVGLAAPAAAQDLPPSLVGEAMLRLK